MRPFSTIPLLCFAVFACDVEGEVPPLFGQGRGGAAPIAQRGGRGGAGIMFVMGGSQGGSGQGGSGGAAAGRAGNGGSAPTSCPPVCGPSFGSFFDETQIATLNVYIEGDDLETYTPSTWLDLLWTKWKHCPPWDNYVRSRMVYTSAAGSFELENVGIRLRGSRKQPVQGFKLDFQRLLGTAATGSARRRFGDVNRLNVLSIEEDDSHLIQCLAYKTLRKFGVQAPRCNHLKVYVNDQFYGLLENVEEADNGRFLRHHWGTNQGLLVEASPSESTCGFPDGKADLEYLGDTFTGAYTTAYKIERGTIADAEKSLIPMFKCGDPDSTPDDAAFKSCISQWLDVDQWLRLIAFESLAPELDTFIGYKRNFYMYFHPEPAAPHAGRFLIYPWDLDTAFQRSTCYPTSCDPFTSVASSIGARGKRPVLVTRLTTVFKAEYCALMKTFLEDVFDPSLVDEMALVMQDAIEGDPHVTVQDWQAEVTKIRNHIESRRASAMSQVDAACP
jgi:spore coat protein CotH